MLIIVKHWNLHGLPQHFFDVEALRCLNVLKVNATEGGFQELADLDDLVGVAGIQFDVKDVHIGKALEQDGLAFHHWLTGEGPNVPQAKDCGPIAYYSNQVTAGGVFESIVRILHDLQTRISNPGSVGQAEITLGTAWLGRRDFDFSGARAKMIV